MEANAVDEIPVGADWQYEPKWDGFRCLAFRDDGDVELRSKSGQPLGRYFPEVVAAVAALKPTRFALDGELVIRVGDGLSFDALLQRIHPAASRVRKLAAETPAWLVAFDLLADSRRAFVEEPLALRREKLEDFAERYFPRNGTLRLSPAATDLAMARRWYGAAGVVLDGIIAKRRDQPYAAGSRDAMVKVKPVRTADCVIGGFRYAEGKRVVGSLLLGLYDDEGLLHHVGFCSGIKASERAALTKKLEAVAGAAASPVGHPADRAGGARSARPNGSPSSPSSSSRCHSITSVPVAFVTGHSSSVGARTRRRVNARWPSSGRAVRSRSR